MKERLLVEFERGRGVLRITRSGQAVNFRTWNARGDEKGYRRTAQSVAISTSEISQLIQVLQNITSEVSHE